MIEQALHLQKTRKYIIQGLLFFTFFMMIYFIVDYLNMSYAEMIKTFGLYLVIINVILNVVMSLASSLLMNLSTAMVTLKGKEGVASNLGFFSVLFGILTYGCTSCVIAFLAAVGITFSVVVLPLAGLPYKLFALLLIFIGLFWITKEIKHGTCKVK